MTFNFINSLKEKKKEEGYKFLLQGRSLARKKKLTICPNPESERVKERERDGSIR